MYVREARNRDEVWLLDQIEELDLDDAAFRSRDYVIAVDEDTNVKAGFGRIRIHKNEADYCELTSIGVLGDWQGQGVRAHVIERLVENARDEGFDTIYVIDEADENYTQFGFEPTDEETVPDPIADRIEIKANDIDGELAILELDIDSFVMPEYHREAFKEATEEGGEPDVEETAEDFGIDPESATYKYDTGR